MYTALIENTPREEGLVLYKVVVNSVSIIYIPYFLDLKSRLTSNGHIIDL